MATWGCCGSSPTTPSPATTPPRPTRLSRTFALFEAVAEAQAALVARWMLVGFVHGVMNTDNTSISGETLDYGPSAFMDAYDPATVFSSIDHGGRYAFGNQPLIVRWNLARLGEAMLALFADELEPAVEAANGVLETVADRYERHWLDGMRAKLGLRSADPGDGELARDLLDVLHAQQIDYTSCFRALSAVATGDVDVARRLFTSPETFDSWTGRWRARLDAEARPAAAIAAAMERTNPAYIPRNHLVEEALTASTGGDLGAYEQLLEVITHPFESRSGLGALCPAGSGQHRAVPHVLRHLRKGRSDERDRDHDGVARWLRHRTR